MFLDQLGAYYFDTDFRLAEINFYSAGIEARFVDIDVAIVVQIATTNEQMHQLHQLHRNVDGNISKL